MLFYFLRDVWWLSHPSLSTVEKKHSWKHGIAVAGRIYGSFRLSRDVHRKISLFLKFLWPQWLLNMCGTSVLPPFMGNMQEVLRHLGAAFFLASPTPRVSSSQVQYRSASFPVQVLVYSRLGKMSQWDSRRYQPAFVTKLKRGEQAQSLEAYLYGFYFLLNLILLIPYDSIITISSNGLFIGVHLIIH